MNTDWRKFMVVAGACLLLISCAQTGPPLPPSLELPRPPSDLRVARKGNVVTLIWSEPQLTTDRQSVRYLGATRICRSTAEEITECGNPVGEAPAPAGRTPHSQQATSQTAADTIPPSLEEQNPIGDITYAVEVLNRDGRSAGLSNRVHIPAAPTLPPPQDLAADLSDDGVTLTWTAIAEAPAIAGVQHRYRVYRREEGADKDAVAGEISLGAPGPVHYLDASFEWEKTYFYRITVVSVVAQAKGEARVEGDDSSPIRVVAHDVFPPAVPSGLQAVASSEGQKVFVDLIWAPVTEQDLAGYNVYRREPDGTAVKLNADLVKAPAYRDSTVATGKSYLYSVSSVDIRGNESAKSEEAAEAVPEVH
jgi:hypothetical protein